MCTVALLRRPDHDWPLLLAANRDEQAARPWRPPARHWPDRPQVTAGMDELAGGTWLGMNDWGVVAGVLNRKDSLGPDPALRSRGELALEALEHADAVAAAEAMADLDPAAYRSFYLFVADDRDALLVTGAGPAGPAAVSVTPLDEGLSMITAFGLDAANSARTARFRPLFEAAVPPDPDAGDWGGWAALMGRRDFEPGAGAGEAMYVVTDRGFGTLSTSLIALGRPDSRGPRVVWRFAGGPPDAAEWQEVSPLPALG